MAESHCHHSLAHALYGQAYPDQAAVSAEKGITINPAHVRYAGKLAKRFLWLAVLLHVCTAIALYLLAYFQITAIGYWASVATLLLTLFRPLQWAYEHLVYRLSTISQQIRYPREDVYELSQRANKMQSDLTWVLNQVATDREESWASKQEKAQARVSASLD